MAKVDVRFENGRVYAKNLPKPKKITGTRFGAVLEANNWMTPFQVWCEITKAWCKPFEGTRYTEAGKVIEDKQLNWFARYLPVVRPEEVYGKNFFDYTHGDFFPDNEIFGGMWDSLVGTKDAPEAVIECKTTKRSEDWENDVPEYYALQSALYAYLLGLDDVYMVVTFLDERDYDHAESFECNPENTTYVHFKVSERYPKFSQYIDYCKEFWTGSVLSGESPLYDSVKDKEYIDALRTTVVDGDTDIEALVAEADELYDKLEAAYAMLAKDEKRLKQIEEMLKKYVTQQEGDRDGAKYLFKGGHYTWTVACSMRESLDNDRLKKDGLYDKYITKKESVRITKTKNKDGEE